MPSGQRQKEGKLKQEIQARASMLLERLRRNVPAAKSRSWHKLHRPYESCALCSDGRPIATVVCRNMQERRPLLMVPRNHDSVTSTSPVTRLIGVAGDSLLAQTESRQLPWSKSDFLLLSDQYSLRHEMSSCSRTCAYYLCVNHVSVIDNDPALAFTATPPASMLDSPGIKVATLWTSLESRQ